MYLLPLLFLVILILLLYFIGGGGKKSEDHPSQNSEDSPSIGQNKGHKTSQDAMEYSVAPNKFGFGPRALALHVLEEYGLEEREEHREQIRTIRFQAQVIESRALELKPEHMPLGLQKFAPFGFPFLYHGGQYLAKLSRTPETGEVFTLRIEAAYMPVESKGGQRMFRVWATD